MLFSKFLLSAAVLAGFTILPQVTGHTWIEELEVIGGSGTKGYHRNDSGRVGITDADVRYTYRITTAGLSVPVCSTTETAQTQNSGFPRLQAKSGATIGGFYKENGHLSKPNANDSKPGTIYWYGTTSPNSASTLRDVRKWTADGTGGDKTGKLLGTTNFDDGTCTEYNDTEFSKERQAKGGKDLCQSNFTLPDGLTDGSVYSVYWVWDFSGNWGSAQPDRVEWYTSCIDIDVKSGSAKLRRS
ncbi:hypothetical protein RUND412_000373 [Rhizina undulata]